MKKIVEYRLISSPNEFAFCKELKETIEYMDGEGYEVEVQYSTAQHSTVQYSTSPSYNYIMYSALVIGRA